MNDITASIIVACQTSGAVASIGKLKYALAQITRYAVNFAVESISAFSELEESTQKFNVVFAGLGKQSKKVVDELIKGYGQSELSAKNMLGATGDLLTGFGVAKDQALGLAEGAAKLGADLASFSNYAGGAEGATNALTKAMLGERESLKMLGVVIREDDASYKKLTKQAMTTGVTIKALNKTFKVDNLQQAKAVATLALAYQQSKNAIGDFARSSDSIANSSRSLENRFVELKAAFGGFLNEFLRVGAVKGGLADTLQQFTETLKAKTPEWSLAINKFVISSAMGFKLIWQVASNIMTNVATVFVYAWDVCVLAWKDAPGFFGAIWEDIKLTANNSFDAIKTVFVANFDFWSDVLNSFTENWYSIFVDMGDIAFRGIKSIAVSFKDNIFSIIKLASSLGKNFWDLITGKKSYAEATSGVVGDFTRQLEEMADNQAKVWEGFEFGKGTKKFASDVLAAEKERMSKIASSLKKIGSDFGKNTSEYLEKNGVKMGEFVAWDTGFDEIIDKWLKKIKALDKKAGEEKKSNDSPAKKIAETFVPNMGSLREDLTRNRATAQRAIMANSTEAITLQSRNFSATNYQDVMMKETKKQSSALESINRNTRDPKLKITSVKLG